MQGMNGLGHGVYFGKAISPCSLLCDGNRGSGAHSDRDDWPERRLLCSGGRPVADVMSGSHLEGACSNPSRLSPSSAWFPNRACSG
jgi:hypothetical protein